jgi:threonine dehydrogenase-like Zn-dependent dehydrogenase
MSATATPTAPIPTAPAVESHSPAVLPAVLSVSLTEWPAPPQTRRVWEVDSAGIENLRLRRRPLPEPGPDEALVRIDAVGLCASDVKIINQGPRHVRLAGRDLKADPVVLGHEVSLTVIRPGRRRSERYPVGSRWVVEPNVRVGGRDASYGFALDGGYQDYQVLPSAVLDGHLLPVPAGVGHAQAAVTEPWGCVYFSYTTHRPNRGVKLGGTTWLAGSGPVGLMHLEKALADGASRVIVTERNSARLEAAGRRFAPIAARRGAELLLIDLNRTPLESVAALGPGSADDIVILAPDPTLVPAALTRLARGGVLNIFAGFPEREKAVMPVDFYDLHYRNATVISTSGTSADAMRAALADSAAGRIEPFRSVAAVGGLAALADGVAATAAGRLTGRVVIYPQIDLPLTPVEELSPDGIWSAEAERRLLADATPGEMGRG